MVFSSVIFMFYFLPAVMILYFAVRKELRNPVLLAASLLFYAWGEPGFVIILVLSVAVNYLAGIGIGRWEGTLAAKGVLLAGISVNLGILFYYKYSDFAISILNRVTAGYFDGGG